MLKFDMIINLDYGRKFLVSNEGPDCMVLDFETGEPIFTFKVEDVNYIKDDHDFFPVLVSIEGFCSEDSKFIPSMTLQEV